MTETTRRSFAEKTQPPKVNETTNAKHALFQSQCGHDLHCVVHSREKNADAETTTPKQAPPYLPIISLLFLLFAFSCCCHNGETVCTIQSHQCTRKCASFSFSLSTFFYCQLMIDEVVDQRLFPDRCSSAPARSTSLSFQTVSVEPTSVCCLFRYWGLKCQRFCFASLHNMFYYHASGFVHSFPFLLILWLFTPLCSPFSACLYFLVECGRLLLWLAVTWILTALSSICLLLTAGLCCRMTHTASGPAFPGPTS